MIKSIKVDKNIIIEYDNKDNIMDYLNQNEGEFIFIKSAHDKKFIYKEKNIIFLNIPKKT